MVMGPLGSKLGWARLELKFNRLLPLLQVRLFLLALQQKRRLFQVQC